MKSPALTALSFLSVCLISALSSAAYAGIYLDRVIVEFDPQGLPRQDVVVFNDDTSENAYVDVEVYEVLNPGTEQEQRLLVEDPSMSDLLVTPARMVIPPSGKVQVRMVGLAESHDNDKIFRVNFTPVLPPLETQESAVRIVVAYQALVIMPPADPVSDISFDRVGNRITFTNNGNSYAKLEAGEVCGESSCQELPTKRLYAGNTWSVDLPLDGSASYRVVNERNTRLIQID